MLFLGFILLFFPIILLWVLSVYLAGWKDGTIIFLLAVGITIMVFGFIAAGVYLITMAVG